MLHSQNKLTVLLVFFIPLILLAFSGCSQQQGGKTANLVYVNWVEGVDYTNLAKVVLTDKMGYDVTITAADPGPSYAAVAKGDRDAFMESWLPVLHKNYMDKFGDQLTDLGNVYEGTQSGLVVPTYVTIDSISQLNSVEGQFDGEITGIDPGAGIMQTTEQVIDQYNLDFELIESSGPAMISALQKSLQNKDWIVVTGWKPHWMFGQWDLKFLKQSPDKIMWKKGNIHIMGRKNLRQDKPELAQFLSNMHFTDSQLADLMVYVRNRQDQDTEEVVRSWMQEHPDLINSWIPEGAGTESASM